MSPGSSVERAPDLQVGGRGLDPRSGLMTFPTYILMLSSNIFIVDVQDRLIQTIHVYI